MNAEEEIACLKCGSNEFKLTRATKGQILAECLKCGFPHLMEGVSIFWNPENEETETEDEAHSTLELRLESHKVPKKIDEKSVEELSNEMLEFIEKESLNDLPFYEISRIFWSKKGLDIFMLTNDSNIALKRLKVENNVKEKMGYLGEKSPNQLRKEKEMLNSLKSKVLDMAKRDDKKTLTHADVRLYLLEIEQVLPQDLQRMLYQLVNSGLKK